MGLTLSHLSALDAVRSLRAEGHNLREMEPEPLAVPAPWVGRRWGPRAFGASVWRWARPRPGSVLHIMVPQRAGRVGMQNVAVHTTWYGLPPNSVLRIDEHSSVVCPELLFLQLADVFSMPALVMLGYELCGYFSRDAERPLAADVRDHIPRATSVASIASFLRRCNGARGVVRAREAVRYVADHALSPPEAVLGTMYSLPPRESGYGMGPVMLNSCIEVDGQVTDGVRGARARYPDVLFGFAPIGLNYDGSGHLDLASLVEAAQEAALAPEEGEAAARVALAEAREAVRKKVLDDQLRNRQLMARGKVVLPITKEDLYGPGGLDELTRQILGCARNVFQYDTSAFERVLDNTAMARDRQDLLCSLVSNGGNTAAGHGII